MPHPPSELKKLDEELNRAMDMWTDLVQAADQVAWPPVENLKDISDASAAWQDLFGQFEDLRDQCKEVEHIAKEIDDQLDKLTAKMRSDDPDVTSNEPLVRFLGTAVPERRYELDYDIKKLTLLTERIRAEGKVEPSIHWSAQLQKIRHSIERGFNGCQWQLDEVTHARQSEQVEKHGLSAAAPGSGSHIGGHQPAPFGFDEPEHHHESHEEREPHEEREEPEHHAKHEAQEGGFFEEVLKGFEEGGGRAAEEGGGKPAEEEVGGLAGIAAHAAEAVEAAASSASSGDSDARVEEDVLDGM